MKSIDDQLEIIKSLIGEIPNFKIKEDGFMSRGFVINNGKLVFKFPRNKNVKYDEEIENLNFINTLNLGINLQKVAFISKTNEYLGVYGVEGTSIENKYLTFAQKISVGNQLGIAIKKLHNANHKTKEICTLRDEISAWQKRFSDVSEFIKTTFSEKEQAEINNLMLKWAPKKLNELGENLVYSHGDLGDGNIFIDKNEKIGIIDFSESCLLDEAADFMDIQDETICENMLLSYEANDILKEKVLVRRIIRPLIVLKPYINRGNQNEINNLIKLIRKNLKIYESLEK